MISSPKLKTSRRAKSDLGSEIKTAGALNALLGWRYDRQLERKALMDRVPSLLWHIINLKSNQIALCSVSIEPCVSITHSVWTTCQLLNQPGLIPARHILMFCHGPFLSRPARRPSGGHQPRRLIPRTSRPGRALQGF